MFCNSSSNTNLGITKPERIMLPKYSFFQNEYVSLNFLYHFHETKIFKPVSFSVLHIVEQALRALSEK